MSDKQVELTEEESTQQTTKRDLDKRFDLLWKNLDVSRTQELGTKQFAIRADRETFSNNGLDKKLIELFFEENPENTLNIVFEFNLPDRKLELINPKTRQGLYFQSMARGGVTFLPFIGLLRPLSPDSSNVQKEADIYVKSLESDKSHFLEDVQNSVALLESVKYFGEQESLIK